MVCAAAAGGRSARAHSLSEPLDRSSTPSRGCSRRVPYVDLAANLGGADVDLLKVDIEGSEYAFVEHNGEVLARSRLLLMEIHEAPQATQRSMFEQIEAAGLRPFGRAVDADGLQLRAWSRGG